MSNAESSTALSPASLTSASNPESGPTSYTLYDEDGNLKTKMDARSVVAQYEYDDLNRVQTKIYSDGTPKGSYVYDTVFKGRITSASTLASNGTTLTSATCTYDNLGRIKTSAPN